jgi:hypothetical protein
VPTPMGACREALTAGGLRGAASPGAGTGAIPARGGM